MRQTVAVMLEDAIRLKAEKQARNEAKAFERDQRDLLVKHGIDPGYSSLGIAMAATQSFIDARTAMLTAAMQEKAVLRLLGDDGRDETEK